MRKIKRILSVVLVWAMIITQNLSAIRPAFANVNNETVGEGVEEDIIIEESTTEEIDAGSHPQEGSFGETHLYNNDEGKATDETFEVLDANETTVVANTNETTVGADIPETIVGADIIRLEEESQTEVNSSGSHPQESSFGETHPYNNDEGKATDETSEVLDANETTVVANTNETTVGADIPETTVGEDIIRPEEEVEAGSQAHPYDNVEGEETTSTTELAETIATSSEIISDEENIATSSEIIPDEDLIATQSEIIEVNEVAIATQSEIEIIESPSEIEIIATQSEIIEIATLSEIALVATVSEMSAMNFEMQLINQNAKFTKNENEYILDEDLILTDTLHVHEEVVLNLNSHTITAPENGSAIYIENNFTLTGTLNEMSDETDFTQEIRGTNNVYPAVEAKNAKVFLNNGTIRGAEGGAALLIEDSDVEVNGAVLVGGNGASYETRQGDDGGDGVQIIFNDKNHTFKFNYGIIIGGDGGRGTGKIIAAGGAALNIGDSQILSEKLTLGEMGEEGGGNGGNAINILETKNADDNVIINGMAIAAGNGGKSAVNDEDENRFLLFSAGTLPETYDLRDKDGKNYITSLKTQGSTGWCARFTAIAGAETDLIVNYRDYLEKNGYNVEKTLAGEDNPDEINLSEAHLGIYDQYQAMDVFGNAGLSYSVPSTSNPKYFDNGQADPCLSAYLSSWRDIQKEEVKPWSERLNYPSNLTDASKKEVASDKPFAVMTNSKIVSFDAKSSDTDEEYKKKQDAFVNSIKESILNGNGAKVGIQVYQKNGWTKSNVEYNGKKYHTFNLSRASFSELSKKNDSALGGHAMYAIGWDDNFPKELFGNYERNITEDGAILVKNSWGSFTWITYQYAFNNAAANEMEFIPSNDYENIYYYDGGTGYTTYSFNGTEDEDGYKNVYNILANSFVIKNDQEKIRAISYNAATKGVPVDVYIYKADSDTVEGINAATGGIKSMTAFNNDPIFKTSITFNTGTTFIPIEPAIEAKKGEVYFVMVDYKNAMSTLLYIDEAVGNDYTTPANHSYVASRRKTDGSKLIKGTDESFHTVSEWFDKYGKKTAKGNTNLNFRIKLITNNYITLDAGDGYFDDDTSKTKDYTYLNIEDQYGDLKKPTSNDPKKEFSHYDFDGTYNIGDTIDVESTTEYVPEYAKAMVLHAIYKDKPTYTITFDAGDAEAVMPTGQKTLTFYEGEDKKLIEVDYTRENFKLASWTNQETGAEVALDANVNTFEGKDITLVANWVSVTAPTYTIIFDANGGEMPTGEKTQSYLEGESTTILQVDYTRDGYDLTGWVIDGTSTKVSLDANVNTLGNKDITLKAEWTKIPTYTITFETNGGTAPTGKKTMTYIKNEDKQLITVDYVRKGYKLDAWINASDNSIVALDANVNTLGNKNITLKASWLELSKKKYTITYDPGDSAAVMPTGLKTQEFYEGDTGKIINVDYKIENKVIDHWKREDTGKDVLLGAKLNTLEGDGYDTIKLIAVWRAASQGNYDKGGSSSSSSGSSSSGSGSGSSSGGRISAGSIGINETNIVTSAGPGALDPLQVNTNPTLNQNVVTPTITPTVTSNEHYVTRASYNPVQGTSEAATTFSNGKWEIDPNTNTWNYKVELEGYGEVKAVGWVNDVAFNAATNANESHKYYFDNDGQMVAGFITDSFGNTYYMDETAGANLGRMVTGPRMIGGYMYYFFDNGVMLKNYEVDGHVVDSEGRFIS